MRRSYKFSHSNQVGGSPNIVFRVTEVPVNGFFLREETLEVNGDEKTLS